jgi:hypothetical protein
MKFCMLAWLLFALALPAHAANDLEAADDSPANNRQILVMLPQPPAHYRPDADYPGGYDASAGRAAGLRIATEVARAYGLTLVQDWPMPALGLNCYVMEVPRSESVDAMLQQLPQDKRVESAQEMNRFHALAHNDPLYAVQPGAMLWHLDDIHRVATGRGVVIAQVDTGVEVGHPDLAGQVAISRNFVDDASDVAELHGTAVAGVMVARSDNGVGIVGVAPQARLLALRACWQAGTAATTAATTAASCNSFTLAGALQFALDRRAPIINLSLTGPPDRLLARLLDAAWKRGVIVVAAADPQAPDGGFPASHAHVLSVGQLDASGSGGPPGVDVWAPGNQIPTTEPGGRWGFVSGSSFAAAHVSGIIALLLELAPALSPQQVRTALASGQRPLDALRTDAIGRIDSCAVVSRLVSVHPVCRDALELRAVFPR